MHDYISWKAVFLLFLICIPGILTAQNAINNPQAQQLLCKSNKTQLFIENKGQWPKQVKYLARLGGMNAWITDSGVVYDYYRIDRNYSPDSLMLMLPHEKDEFERTHTSCKGHVVRMDYIGINPNAEKLGKDKREAYYNYFIGNDSTKWANFVGLYGEVLVKEAYQGIDIRYYFDSGQIRYDYLVNPGADISQINFRLTGADALAVNESGELIIKTSLGDVKHGKLYAYQQMGNEKREVSCRFGRNEDGDFRVIASNYEKGLALVIDPLVWSTFLGGIRNDIATSFLLDNNYNVILTGSTTSSNFPTTLGVYDITQNGSQDIFLTKLNSTAASLIYSTFIGSSEDEQGNSVIIDIADNTYLCGYTRSYNFPTTIGCFDKTYNASLNNSNAYVIKLNSSGSVLIYSTFLGGSIGEVANSIKVDELGYAYITGSTISNDYPTTKGAFNQMLKGGEDVFVTKLNTTGSALVYSTIIGGSLSDGGSSIILDSNYNSYIFGTTESNDFPTTPGVYDQTFNGYTDCFITKLNSNGSALIFSTYMGGNNIDYCYNGIILDSGQNIYITGGTRSTNYPTTKGSYNQIHNANAGNDIFISKLNSSATLLINSTFLGGNNEDVSQSIALDIDKNIYLTGWTRSTNYPVTTDAFIFSLIGNVNAFITKLNSDLSILIYSTYFGGSDGEVGRHIFIDTNKTAYVAGYTFSSNFLITDGAYDKSFNGIQDAFISKLAIFKQANSISTQNISCSKMRIKLKKGEGAKRLVFMKQGSSGLPLNANNTTYIANTVFGSGSYTGNGWYCVYNDTGTSFTVSGLNPNTIYRTMVLEYIGSRGNEIYNTDTSINNPVNQNSGTHPIALFSVNDSIQCKGRNFVFTNNSTTSSGIISSIWWFGDGDSSSIQNPQHSYVASKTYDVKLVVSTGSDCSDSIIQKVYLFPSPTASFSINDSTQCFAGNNFAFTNKSSVNSGSFSSNWQFGDGNGSIIPNPSHCYVYTDTFSVKLIVISDSGCKDSVINKVTVSKPEAKFIAYDSSQCLERNNFAFTNKSLSQNGSVNCKWNFGDSIISTVFNPMHAYNYADTFTVTLIITDTFGCNDTFSKHTWVHVHPEPLANFAINDNSQCLNGNVFVQSNSSTIKSGTFIQKWEFDDGNDTNNYNSSHSYSMADSYMVKLLIVSDWGCKDSILKKVYVRPMPFAGFLMNTNPQYLPGNNYSFTNKTTVPSGIIHSYWDFGDGDTSSQTDPSHKYQKVDTFDVKLIAISDYGCKDSISQKVWLLYIPMNIQFNVKNACLGDTAFFKNNSTVAPPDSFLNFLWDFGDGATIVKKEPKHIYASAGKYIISLVALTAFGSKDTLIDTIEIFDDPLVNITATPDTIVVQGSPVTLTATGLYNQLLWFDNSTSGSVNVTSEGTYWVTASYDNGCKSSDTIILTKGDIKGPELVNVITPNGDGFNDFFVIKNIDSIKPCKLSIYNRWGDELFSTSDYQNNWDGTYKGKKLPEGTYYYVLVAKDGKVYKGAVNILK